MKAKKDSSETLSTNTKLSFASISYPDTQILILGSLPGDKSIALNEYYGHPRNRFWKIIATISANDFPLTYSEKIALLKKLKIGVWDVTHKAIRNGSLDSAIKEEEPNDLEQFIANHPNLKTIGFNGKTSEALFNKYFDKKANINYVSLPSTSPANARFTFEMLTKLWQELFIK